MGETVDADRKTYSVCIQLNLETEIHSIDSKLILSEAVRIILTETFFFFFNVRRT
jgi:hypothetical protein